MRAMKSVFAVMGAGVLALVGCQDSNTDNTKPLPPPKDAVTGTKGPQEAAAEAKANRKGAHFQALQNEQGGSAPSTEGPGEGR